MLDKTHLTKALDIEQNLYKYTLTHKVYPGVKTATIFVSKVMSMHNALKIENSAELESQ